MDTVERNARVIEEYISLAVKSRKMQTTAGKYHFERFVVRRFFAAAVEKQPRSRIASSVPVTTGVPASSPFSRAALMVHIRQFPCTNLPFPISFSIFSSSFDALESMPYKTPLPLLFQ